MENGLSLRFSPALEYLLYSGLARQMSHREIISFDTDYCLQQFKCTFAPHSMLCNPSKYEVSPDENDCVLSMVVYIVPSPARIPPHSGEEKLCDFCKKHIVRI